jgi:hypothetical protein
MGTDGACGLLLFKISVRVFNFTSKSYVFYVFYAFNVFPVNLRQTRDHFLYRSLSKHAFETQITKNIRRKARNLFGRPYCAFPQGKLIRFSIAPGMVFVDIKCNSYNTE